MNVERDLIISILKLTRETPASTELVKINARLPDQLLQKLLQKLQKDGLINVEENNVETDTTQRLKLAINALRLGADVATLSGFLRWKEFEDMAAIALQRNGFTVTENLRFKHGERRWEIDVVGCRKPLALCIDCKHWHRGISPLALRRVVQEQTERASAFAETMPKLHEKVECASWDRTKVIPLVLSLTASESKFCDDVPIVPVLQLQDFLNQLPAYADGLKHFQQSTVRQMKL